jgi:acetamidase/formamidase
LPHCRRRPHAGAGHYYKLKATPKTVAWGYYAANTPPALRIRSGDSVEVETLITNSPERLEAAGVPPADVEPALRDIYREVTDKGPGGHILTGPIYVEGAEPGDTLEVRIRSIRLAIPYAYNTFRPGAGFLPDEFPYARTKIIPLDRERMIARFSPASRFPCGRSSAAWAWRRRRTSDASAACRPGSTPATSTTRSSWRAPRLFIPVHARGALFQVGDGHAGQGNGEVDITALETSLTGVFQFVVRKDLHLRWPRGETPTHYITMGMHEDLREAARLAVEEMIDFLVTEKH